MADLVIRPSTRLIKVMYVLAALLAAALLAYSFLGETRRDWLLLAPAVILLLTVRRHMGRMFETLTITGDRIRYHSGIVSRTTRTIDTGKVQDVRVEQSMGQRMMGTGNLSIETAGEAGRLTIGNIDRPHAAADRILGATSAIK